jgi:hypothetical protein
MLELPRRNREVRVDVEGGVTLVLEAMTDDQYFRAQETAEREGEGDELRLIYRASRLPGLFESRIRRVEGATVDGQPFDVAKPDHLERVPHHWKALAFSKLVRHALSSGLSEAERGNSTGPAGSSTTAGTSSPA